MPCRARCGACCHLVWCSPSPDWWLKSFGIPRPKSTASFVKSSLPPASSHFQAVAVFLTCLCQGVCEGPQVCSLPLRWYLTRLVLGMRYLQLILGTRRGGWRISLILMGLFEELRGAIGKEEGNGSGRLVEMLWNSEGTSCTRMS